MIPPDRPGTANGSVHPRPALGHPPGTRPPRILLVCTANQCRSPFAAAVAQAEAARRTVELEVGSAGFLDPGLPAADRVRRLASAFGLDLSEHTSRNVEDVDLEEIDVVLTMEGSHVVDLVTRHPALRSRLLTLRQAASALEDHPVAEPPLDGAGLRRWTAEVVGESPALAGLLDPSADVADPMGGTMRAHKRMAAVVTEAISALFDAWFGPSQGEDGPATPRGR